MNVYNEAHNLSAAIKECEEYKVYIDLKNKINGIPELAKMINDFQQQQIEYQVKLMSGEGDEDSNREMIEKAQQLYGIISKDPIAAEYLQAEMRFNIMMNDVFQIVKEPLEALEPAREKDENPSDVAK